MLSELKGLDSVDERFDAKMSVLMENVRRHVEEEEKQWFPDVREAMGRNRLSELGEQMVAAKKKSPPIPSRFPAPSSRRGVAQGVCLGSAVGRARCEPRPQPRTSGA
ncbi:hypothetical protein [Streptomyces goshikiensis]|uniref:hypothetical protein n=1 Tax=Streptomyces goshikiensis TaxID=1942 RepID=UPI00368976E7